VSLQLPATYDEFVEHVFAKDRDEIGGLSFVIVFARQSTAAGECAFGAAGECGCCGQSVLNVEPFVEAAAARYRLNQGQRDELRARLMDDGELKPTEDGICGRCGTGL
jgi:hypothetical protein